MRKPDGGHIDIELLLALQWLEAADLPMDPELRRGTMHEKVGVQVTIQLDLPELGAAGPATLTSIGPCPPIQAGPGCVVTGTFRRQAGEILTLTVCTGDGQSEQIGVTANHPVWSVDRQEFVPAGELRPQEHLETVLGKPVFVVAITSRGPPQTVYNLEVAGEHAYAVTSYACVVHNSCTGPAGYTGDQHALIDLAWEMRLRGRTRPVSREEVQILFEWADEVGLPRDPSPPHRREASAHTYWTGYHIPVQGA